MAQQFILLRDARQGRTFMGWSEHRFYLVTENGDLAYTAPFAPVDVDMGDLAAEWAEAERTGLDPLLLPKGGNLGTRSFTLKLSDPYGNAEFDVVPQIETLQRLARSPQRLFIVYGSTEIGLWRMSSLAIQTTKRHPVTNEPVEGTASITMTVASDPTPGTGPVTGGATGQPAGVPTTPASVIGVPRTTYTIAAGDSLLSIAQKLYGDPGYWKRLLDANPTIVANPQLLVQGAVLVVP